jgi:hypothetical protein
VNSILYIGTQIGLNVITEFVIGLLIPGQTIAVISFKSLGYNVFVGDIKLAHYMHIAPLSMVHIILTKVAAQLIGTIIGIIFNTVGAFVVMSMSSPAIFVDNAWKATNYNIFLTAAGI